MIYKSSPWIKWLLVGLSVTFVVTMIVLPLIYVMYTAFSGGWKVFSDAITDRYALAAVRLTVEVTVLTVLINTVFGLFAAWAITRFSFRGKKLVSTLIDLPLTISPIIAGLIFVLTFGRQSILIPVLNAKGRDEEEAAALMGAGGFTIFRRITFPHIKWAFLYGVVLCAARAMGEFGAVSVLSGHLRGKTNTMPLHIELLYQGYDFTGAFAMSALLVVMAIIILIARNVFEMRGKRKLRKAAADA